LQRYYILMLRLYESQNHPMYRVPCLMIYNSDDVVLLPYAIDITGIVSSVFLTSVADEQGECRRHCYQDIAPWYAMIHL